MSRVCPDPEIVASDTLTVSEGFWLPNGLATEPCPLQQSNPVYFNSNDEFPLAYFVNLHKYVKSFNAYNYCGARVPLAHSKLNINNWRQSLVGYHDTELCDFLEFGWPLGVDPSVELESTLRNHPSSFQFSQEMDAFIVKQIK